MAVETSARNPSQLVGDKTMRDPGTFTVVCSQAPSPLSLWPQAGGLSLPLEADGSDKPALTHRETGTPRLPSISAKPPLPKGLKLIQSDGMGRWSSQLDLAKSGKFPEPGILNTVRSNSCPSIKDSCKGNRTLKTATTSCSPASARRFGPRDREATNKNSEMLTVRNSIITLESGDGPVTLSASKKRIGTSARVQDTQRSLHKSPSFPQSLSSLKDSKQSSNSSHSTMASNVPKQASSLNSRRLSTVSDRSPMTQRKMPASRQITNNGSFTSRTQLTTKILKSNNKIIDRSQQQETSLPVNEKSGLETVEMNGKLVSVPDGMSKEAFKLCWQWVSAVEEARPESQTFDLVMDSMIDWDGTESVQKEGEDNKS